MRIKKMEYEEFANYFEGKMRRELRVKLEKLGVFEHNRNEISEKLERVKDSECTSSCE